MARVQGPLHSDSASGTIAGQITFASWKGRPLVRQRVTPSNPQSAAQTAVRAMMRYLSQRWQNLAAPPKASWEDLAASQNFAPFNAYVQQNMLAWRDQQQPIETYGTPLSESVLVTPTLELTVTGRQVSVYLEDDVAGNPIGAIIYRKLGSAPSGTLSEVVRVLELVATEGRFIDRVPTAGTWHYKAQSFDYAPTDGRVNVISLDATAVVA